MALPDPVRVRISSEAAGAISMTPVVSQTVPLRNLVEIVLATTGKDPARVCEVLLRGAVVQGASRFRWESLHAESNEIQELLRTFPDPDPRRAFQAERCVVARIKAGRHTIEIPREIAAKRRLLKRRSFWDALLALAVSGPLEYIDYSYRTRTDEFRLQLTAETGKLLQESAGLLRYSGIAAQLLAAPLESIDYSVRFP